jgi:dephospho-CoA kinase
MLSKPVKPIVICLSGRIGSGKTSMSAALARARGAASVSFGAYVRTAAAARGLDSTHRETLQNLGAKLIEDHGHDWFCREVLATASWDGDRDLVVDGIRHVAVLEVIKRLVAPTNTVLIHLTLNSESDLRARASSRGSPLSREQYWRRTRPNVTFRMHCPESRTLC